MSKLFKAANAQLQPIRGLQSIAVLFPHFYKVRVEAVQQHYHSALSHVSFDIQMNTK